MSDEDTKSWIYAGGLPYELTEGDILCVFSQYGEIFEISLSRDKDTGKSRGFCFLKYEDPRSCELAVDNLNGASIVGRKIKVSYANNLNSTKARRPTNVAPQNETFQLKEDSKPLLKRRHEDPESPIDEHPHSSQHRRHSIDDRFIESSYHSDKFDHKASRDSPRQDYRDNRHCTHRDRDTYTRGSERDSDRRHRDQDRRDRSKHRHRESDSSSYSNRSSPTHSSHRRKHSKSKKKHKDSSHKHRSHRESEYRHRDRSRERHHSGSKHKSKKP